MNQETSIKEADASKIYSLYPNPVDSYLIVKHPTLLEEAIFTVYRMDGKKLRTMPGIQGAEQTVITTEALLPGSYIIKTQNGSKVNALHFFKF